MHLYVQAPFWSAVVAESTVMLQHRWDNTREDLHGMGVWAGGVGHEDPLPDVNEVLVPGRPVEQGLHEGPVQPLTSRVRQALCTTHPHI